MRLLLVIESLTGGGAERQMALLAESLAELGHEVLVSSWASPEVRDAYQLSSGVERIHLRAGRRGSGRFARTFATMAALIKLVRTIRRYSPAAIISFSEASNFLSLLAGRVTRYPVIVSNRADPEAIFEMKPHWRRFVLWTYRRAEGVVVQTEGAARWCRDHCGRDVYVIPNALRELPQPSTGDRPPVIVAVGRLDPQKGHDILIRAFSKLHEDHPQWRLLILGEGNSRAELQNLARASGVFEKVKLRGFTDQVEPILGSCSIFALPSRFEGFPNALIEAMGMGLPCVATDCRYGPAEIVTDGLDGLLIPVDDLAALEEALRLLIEDAPLRTKLAANALTVRAKYACRAVAAQWVACAHAVSTGAGRSSLANVLKVSGHV